MIIFDARHLSLDSNGISNYAKYMLSGVTSNIDEDSLIILRKRNTPIPEFKNQIIENQPINITNLMNFLYKNKNKIYTGNKFIFYSPDFVMPYRWCDKRIITLHDVAGFIRPEYHKKKLSRRFSKAKAYHSTKIITVSEFSKNEIVKHLGVDASKIFVFPALSPLSGSVNMESPDILKNRFPRLDNRKFFLFVGTVEPRKNVQKMITSFVKADHALSGVKLVIVGREGWNTDLNNFVKSSLGQDVIWLENVSDEDRAVLMSNCAAFCYFSKYEGFGLPILEALNEGCLVLTSNVGPISEYFSEYTIQIDPNSEKSIINCFENFKELEARKIELIQKFKASRHRFHFDTVFEKIFNAINDE